MGFFDSLKEKFSGVNRDTVEEAAHTAKEKAGDLVDDARSAASDAADSAKDATEK